MSSRRIILTAILPDGDAAELDRTLSSLRRCAAPIQVIAQKARADLDGFPASAELQGAAPGSLPELLNRALDVAAGEFIAVLPPGVEAAADLPDLIAEWSNQHPDAAYLYGDYDEVEPDGTRHRVAANVAPDDLTEREDWGILEIYRTAELRALGGADETRRFRADYDLRLKLTDGHPALRIPAVLGAVRKRAAQTQPGAEALFFPGRGKLGGFSYLFMDPAEEQEIEAIFYAMLKRRGAWLEGSPGGAFPRAAGTSPRVTVVMPVHNRAGFLPLSVGSVQRGTFQDFEIVIVDNASTDETLPAAQRLAASDPRIRVLSLPDNVIAKALNAGVRAARGEYIAQLDSDDEYTPDTLRVMVEHLDSHPREALAISYYELMNEEGRTLEEFGVIKHLEYNRNNILRVDGAGAVRVWRKAAILEFGGFNEADFGHYGEDYDLVLKAGEKYEVGRVHQVLYRYRRHPGNSDVLRSHELKICNKTLARIRALERRRALNQGKT